MNTITAYIWVEGADSKVVYPEKDGEWYVVTENTTSLNIIFRNGTDWDGDANQTVDITDITTNTCYQLAQEGEAKATYTVVDCEDITTDDLEQLAPTTARKVLYNGSLYIILDDGRVYNVQGNQVW